VAEKYTIFQQLKIQIIPKTDIHHSIESPTRLFSFQDPYKNPTQTMTTNLIAKYNIAGPRYTSYPTVPYWDDDAFSLKLWKQSLQTSYAESRDEGISLYIHLPFCESMCTFCGCTKRITRNHDVEIPYIRSLIKEWQLYIDLLGEKPRVKELHIGGGTPTFFSVDHLQLLLEGIFRRAKKPMEAELSFEGHPNNTTDAHLKMLADLGFTRVSYGVQDYNEAVQKAIHRVQPFENVKRVTENARKFGFRSVGHDIIFGLPFQTRAHVIHTIKKTTELMPDRIAFYSYAHVPWMKGNGQRGYKESDLPSAAEKRTQYETGKQLLLKAGYVEIGLDHFALPDEALTQAMDSNSLHRNFMGYTASKTRVMIGLGASAISDSWYGFAQNVKGVEAYQDLLNDNILPVFRGHILNLEDLKIRRHILNLMCRFETFWGTSELWIEELPDIRIRLMEMHHDGLIAFTESGLKVTEKGRPFVRNICMAFDLRLQRKKPETQLFSMTV
jgi:oxygen-independent coproporphyrinogen-3 oxidase